MTDRDKLLARIRALFAKTVEAGATEAEEIAAAAKARGLVEQYQMDLGAEELKREGFVKKAINLNHAQFAFSRRIMGGIGQFCEVKTYYTTFGSPKIMIFGFRSDTEFASYLIESLTTFALAGADMHIATARKMAIALGTPMDATESREARRSHLLGCATRVTLRLKEMAQERRAQAAQPGSYGALVKLDKPELIRAEMERLNIRLHASSCLTGAGHSESFAAGSAHGAKASFGRPVAGGRIAGLIDRR